MSAITIRNLLEPVHDALRRIAAERHMSVEALAQSTLSDLARQKRRGDIDVEKLARNKVALGIEDGGPVWTEAMDGTALSRRVLGLDPA